MFMRLCTSLSLCLTAAAAVVVPAAVPASAHAVSAGTTPLCVAADAHDFPLATRIRGGPTSYEAGGGYGTWYIDLTNTTRGTCAGIHPVVVLVDDRRALRPGQPQLDFYDGPRARPVTFESTDEQELVGVLDGAGFGGFTVPPGRTVSVRVRLALTSDTESGQVTANAAVVQRRGRDGDWVGQSNAYRFGIGEEAEDIPDGSLEDAEEAAQKDSPESDGVRATAGVRETTGAQAAEGLPTAPSGSAREHTEALSAAPSGGSTPPATSAAPSASSASGTDAPGASLPLAQDEAAGERAHELARTGPGLVHGLLTAIAALVAVGATAHVVARGRR
ncbi:hypothetical protein AB0B37_00080 [Streptomyces olivaceoviridis]|uniref:Gram-positive cocci surface proteins LPxTG domain-containing protein n=2 Tax=Streptomyces TaxID=1883 RepID=A0ABQ3CLF5_9ACTN|nr:hypothetical protein [Streptomyces canarius]GHA19558.1 hypothetical protein GCM10010345_25260 [Streptomyces canarius]